MMFDPNANDIKVSIEIRIEAISESAARRYAARHDIDVEQAKWSANGDDKGGRLYAASTFIVPADD